MSDELNIVGSRIRILRKAKLITQEVLAEQIGIEAKSLGRIEKGAHLPSLETLGKLAVALDVSIHDFFPKSDKTVNEPATLQEVRHRLFDYICTADETTLMRWYREAL